MAQIKKEQMSDPYLKELSDVFDDPKAQDPTDYVMEDGVLYHVSMPVRNDPQPISSPEEPDLDWADDMSVDEPVPVGNLVGF